TVDKNLPGGRYTLTVEKWPEPVPPGFSGAVGDFIVESSKDKTSVEVGEPVEVKIKIAGTGVLALMDDIEIKSTKQYQVYQQDAERNEAQMQDSVESSYSRTFVIVPSRPGRLTLPKIEV